VSFHDEPALKKNEPTPPPLPLPTLLFVEFPATIYVSLHHSTASQNSKSTLSLSSYLARDEDRK